MPKMDRNGYFIYSAATAKKKKISLMQPRPPREAFVEEKCARRPGFAQRVGPIGASSVGSASARDTHPSDMNRSARLHSQLECYQPRYHTIRETPVTERKVHPQDCDGRVKSVRKSGRDSGSPKHQAREYQSPSNFRWVPNFCLETFLFRILQRVSLSLSTWNKDLAVLVIINF